jgi:SAM-dependent methyltransferase
VFRLIRRRLATIVPGVRFRGSADYWEKRYALGGTSGAGSYGEQARYKAGFLNRFVAEHAIRSVIEFGCGDGNQLELAEYPAYTGLDVSATALRICTERFHGDPTKTFVEYDRGTFEPTAWRAELGLSLDVIYHLVEDETFDAHMRDLFGSATRYVVIYARDTESSPRAPHVRRRAFTRWAEDNEPEWSLTDVVRPPIDAYQDFYVFARAG